MDRRYPYRSYFVQRRNMGLSDNKCDKRIINESDKTHPVQGTHKSNNNTIYLKIGEKKIENKKLSIKVQ